MSRRVMVTGAAGFIGSHLVEALIERGHSVRAFIHYNSQNNWGWLETSPYRDDIDIYRGDVRDYDSVSDAMKGVDAVFHLAALIGIPYSYISPQAYIRTNVEGTYNIVQAARERGVSRVVQTSTSEVYGTAEYVPIDEMHPLKPQSPYAATKVAADALALSYFRSFGLPVTVVRPFNTFGPRQSPRAVIPTVITQVLDGAASVRLGDTRPTRDFVFVKDTVDGFIKAGESNKAIGQVINLATGREISVGEMVSLVGRMTGVRVTVTSDEARVRPVSSEVERLCGSAEKALSLIGWVARWTLEDGLKDTIEWLRSNRGAFKSWLYNV